MSAAGFEETELSYAAEDKEDEDEDYNEEGTESVRSKLKLAYLMQLRKYALNSDSLNKLSFLRPVHFLGAKLRYERVCPLYFLYIKKYFYSESVYV